MLLNGQFFILNRAGDLFTAPVFYKILYVTMLAMATYAVVRRQSSTARAFWLVGFVFLSLVFQFRRFGLYPLIWAYDLAGLAVGVAALTVAWMLLRYVIAYYADLFRRTFPQR